MHPINSPAIKKTWVSHDGSVVLYCADCLEILPLLPKVEACISDPPFSARTHDGYNASAAGHAGEGNDGSEREELSYTHWTEAEVDKVMSTVNLSGWLVVFSDYTLGRVWLDAMAACGRYTFAPVPFISVGRSIRLSGDGPSSWTDWLCVSRPAALSRWGTLRGCYYGGREETIRRGGKPLGLTKQVVSDYSRRGDTVLDFCMGAGTTGVACVRTGRSFIGIEIDETYFDIAVKRIDAETRQQKLFP